MKLRTSHTILLIGGIAAVGYLAYTTDRRQRQAAIKKVRESYHRLPAPMTAVEVTHDAENREIIDEWIGECFGRLGEAITPACVAAELYPDLLLPSVPGDHDSIVALESAIRYRINQLLDMWRRDGKSYPLEEAPKRARERGIA